MDILKLLAIAAGFLTIGAAAVLAFRQKTIAWQHVAVFSLGAVLAGISGIQLSGDASKWSVNIGQLAQATTDNSKATTQQADALLALGKRLDQLQTTVASLEAARVAAGGTTSGGTTTGPTPAQTLALHNAFVKLVTSSRTLSQSATTNSQLVQRAAGLPASRFKVMQPAATPDSH
jgi:hypothetical protein